MFSIVAVRTGVISRGLRHTADVRTEHFEIVTRFRSSLDVLSGQDSCRQELELHLAVSRFNVDVARLSECPEFIDLDARRSLDHERICGRDIVDDLDAARRA